MTKVFRFFQQDWLFTLSLILAFFACFYGTFEWNYIEPKTIISLLGLMAVVKYMERIGLLNNLAKRLVRISRDTRALVRNLTFLSFFSSMFLTNDVAILTLLPVFISIVGKNKKFPNLVYSSILIILAANLGSSCLPFGNPQNLFLFSYYNLGIGTFFSWMRPFFLLSVAVLILLLLKVPASPLAIPHKKAKKIKAKSLLLAFLSLALMILSIFDFLPYVVVVPGVLLLLRSSDRKILQNIDYRLLFTFVFFFLIIGNLSDTAFFSSLLPILFRSSTSSLVGSSLLSQLSSNVPAAILVAPFSSQVKSILWGVNIGGMGTMIASLANLIGFKIFSTNQPHLKKKFFKEFSAINFSLLLIYLIIFSFL